MYLDHHGYAPEIAPPFCLSSQDATTPPAVAVSEQQLIEGHLHLVRSAVARIKRIVPAHVDADDLYSVGLAGLVSAVRKFNPVQGRTFAGFAALRVRGAMLDELRRMDSCSRRARIRARKLKTAKNEIEQKLGRAATDEEVRLALGLARVEFTKWVNDAQPVGFLALDRHTDAENGRGISLHDLLADEGNESGSVRLEKAELVQLLTQRIAELPPLQKRILAMYYFEDMRIAEIAKAYGVTSSRISQVHTRTLSELSAWLKVAREQ